MDTRRHLATVLAAVRRGGPPTVAKQVQQRDRVIIRFAGDSGDGMQLTGDRFTQETASFGNDLSTLPNFPAEIRAPAGTLPGVGISSRRHEVRPPLPTMACPAAAPALASPAASPPLIAASSPIFMPATS